MTAVLALKVGSQIWMAADSACASGYNVVHDSNPKIFSREVLWSPTMEPDRSMFIGGGGTSKACVMLQFESSFRVPKHHSEIGDYEYMQCVFAKEMQATMNANQVSTTHDGQFNGQATFIVAYNGHIYEIGTDFHVAKIDTGFCGVGSGSAYGIGYIDSCLKQGMLEHAYELTESERDFLARIILSNAIECACRHNLGCRPPAYILGPL